MTQTGGDESVSAAGSDETDSGGRTVRDGLLARLLSSQTRQAGLIAADVVRMRGLMPLLMKRRNGGRWTADDKAELLLQLRILSRVSPTLVLMLLPGSVVLLPIYAWWLDRRRRPRRSARTHL